MVASNIIYLPNGAEHVIEEPTRRQWTQRMGGGGLHEFSGYLNEEFLSELTGKRGANYFEQMRRNDVAIGTMYTAISMLIRSAQHSIDINVPISERTKAHEDAMKFYEEVIDDMECTVEDIIDDANTCIPHGYSLSEFTFKYRDGKNSMFSDGKLGIKSIEPRSQLSLEKWEFDKDFKCIGYWHAPKWGAAEVYIPLSKSLHFRTTRERNNPEGYSFFRNSVRAYKQVNVVQYAEGIGAERNLAGLPMVRMPLGATSEADYMSARTLVEKVRRDEYSGIVLPPPKGIGEEFKWDFELIASHNVGAGIDTDKIIQRLHNEMMQSMLINFLGSGSGSYASGRVQGDFFQVAVSSILNSYEREINEKISKKLFKLNKFPGLKPNEHALIRLSPISQRNFDAVRNIVRDMAMAGFIDNMGPDIENWLRGMLDLPSITQKDYEEREKEKEITTQKMLLHQQELAAITVDRKAQQAPKDLAGLSGEGEKSSLKGSLKSQKTPRPNMGAKSAKRSDGPTAGSGGVGNNN